MICVTYGLASASLSVLFCGVMGSKYGVPVPKVANVLKVLIVKWKRFLNQVNEKEEEGRLRCVHTILQRRSTEYATGMIVI